MSFHFQLMRDAVSFFDQLEGSLNWGTTGMSLLFNLGDSWPFANNFNSRPIQNF